MPPVPVVIVPAPVGVPVIPVPMVTPSAFTFQGDAKLWAPAMGGDPLIFAALDCVFVAVSPCLRWQPFPAAPAGQTHFTCAFSDLEGLLHSCAHTEDAALLSSAPTLRYTLPSALSAIWDALVEQGMFDISSPQSSLAVFAADLLLAANTAADDARMELSLADTRGVELRVGALRLASDWSDTILSSHLQDEGGGSLRREGLLLRAIAPRFLAANGRYTPGSNLRKMMEVARAHMAQDPVLALDLKVKDTCLHLLALPVAQFWKEVLLPPQLTLFPVGTQESFVELVSARNIAFGNVDEQKRAIAGRLKAAMLHFPSLSEVLVDSGYQPPQQVAALLEQLTRSLLPGASFMLVSTWELMEPLVAANAADRRAAALIPDTAANRVQFHCTATTKEIEVSKLQRKEAVGGGSGSTRYAGVKTDEFRNASALLLPLLADPETAYTTLYQTVVQSGSRLLFMYLAGLSETVPGHDILTSLSIHKGRMPGFLGWCMAVDDLGTVPSRGRDKHVEEGTVKALLAGDFAGTLNLQNLAKTWEQALAGRSYQSLPPGECYLDPLDLNALKKYGGRLLSGIRRHGVGRGSFSWVVDTALELLLSKPSATCDPADLDSLVQWWMDAALTEAGRMFASELRKDADFATPLQDIFLPADASCLITLGERLEAHKTFDQWASAMPHTLQMLIPAMNAPLPTTSGLVVKVAGVPKVPAQKALGAPTPAPGGTQTVPVKKTPAKGPAVTLGSHSHHIRWADSKGKIHKNQAKNTHVFLAKKKVLITAVQKHFGKVLCIPVMMSSGTGSIRYSVCDQGPNSSAPHPDHATSSSVAHVFPQNYRNDIKKYFC
jgi:hypothetical protein